MQTIIWYFLLYSGYNAIIELVSVLRETDYSIKAYHALDNIRMSDLSRDDTIELMK